MKMNDLAPIIGRSPGSPDPEGRNARLAWHDWLASPAGRYVLQWEQLQIDALVADIFGYHALQCGMPELGALRENRIRHRFLALQPGDPPADPAGGGDWAAPASLWLDRYEALPFASQSLDLVVLPHVLEFADHPHEVLREVDRVLRPEGRLVVSGFNPVSLWGARHLTGRALGRPWLPGDAQPLGLPRMRDWLKLLGFEAERGRFGCYRPPFRSERWLARSGFMEAAGDRWWPICGAAYMICAVKRVRAMRLVGLAPRFSPGRSRRATSAAGFPCQLDRAVGESPAIDRD